MINSFTDNNLGALKAILSEHMLSDEVEKELNRFPTQTIIGLGQGGGRIAAELSRFGFPTFLVNSSKSDMEEQRALIPNHRRILTTSQNYPALEGTDKNAQLGFEIAAENQEKYKELALSTEVRDAEFVWVTVSLGGGTGNGALKVALAYLSKVRATKALPGGEIPLGVICSIPSSDERGTSFRRNALAGINLLQELINEKQLGTVLVIDNEKMNDYYAKEPLTTYAGTQIDAKSYSNMVVASALAEISVLPLLHGRSVFDKTELLTTLSTPGWLSISKNQNIQNDDNLEEVISNLFHNNEVLANYDMNNARAGAIAVIYPASKNIAPKIADDVYKYTSELLDTKVNLSISNNSRIKNLTLYGVTVLSTPPVRIKQLNEELAKWEQIEKEQEEANKQVAAGLGLDKFDDFFTLKKPETPKKDISLDDVDFNFNKNTERETTYKAIDLDDVEF